MSLYALEIPDQPAETAEWLEEHLRGLDLAELVAELTVTADEAVPAAGLDDLLGPWLPRVLAEGLTVLPAERLRSLLRQPKLLLDLQERILLEGGACWDRPPETPDEIDRLLKQGWRRLDDLSRETYEPEPRPQTPSVRRWYSRPWFVSLATAAAVLTGVMLREHVLLPDPAPVVTGWEWSRPDNLPDNVASDVYLNRLADAADEWFRQRPATPEALAGRLLQLRQGCTTLIFAEHRPLRTEDRQWLVERCRAWAGRLDEHLAAVEAGGDVLAVRAEVDETVRRLITALRSRAEEQA